MTGCLTSGFVTLKKRDFAEELDMSQGHDTEEEKRFWPGYM